MISPRVGWYRALRWDSPVGRMLAVLVNWAIALCVTGAVLLFLNWVRQ